MKIFLSWSGDRSLKIAESLKKWLPIMFADVESFVSAQDISAGKLWEKELRKNLNKNDICILCITKENLNSPWILFETGVLFKSSKSRKVIPYLEKITVAALDGSPLSHFQAVESDKKGTRKLVNSISESNPTIKRNMEISDIVFDDFWSKLYKDLKKIRYSKYNSYELLTDEKKEISNLKREKSTLELQINTQKNVIELQNEKINAEKEIIDDLLNNIKKLRNKLDKRNLNKNHKKNKKGKRK